MRDLRVEAEICLHPPLHACARGARKTIGKCGSLHGTVVALAVGRDAIITHTHTHTHRHIHSLNTAHHFLACIIFLYSWNCADALPLRLASRSSMFAATNWHSRYTRTQKKPSLRQALHLIMSIMACASGPSIPLVHAYSPPISRQNSLLLQRHLIPALTSLAPQHVTARRRRTR